MSEGEIHSFPAYNDAKDIERRAKLVAQSPVSVDKPASPKNPKPMRFRNMRMKTKRIRKRNPKRPEFY